MNPIRVLLLAFLASIHLSADSKTRPFISPTGVFHNVRYNLKTGESWGIGFVIGVGPSGYWVLYQDMEGPPRQPVLAQASIREESTGRKISFTVPDVAPGDSPGTFSGVIQGNALVGKFDRSPITMTLVRRKGGFWQ